MTVFAKILTGAAGLAMIAGAAAPAAAQAYPYGGYNQGYNANGGVGAIIGQILGGGRYGAYGQGNDRVAVDQCARAAEARISRDPRASGYHQQGYAQPGYGQQGYGYNQAAQARVIAITAVERRSTGLRVTGVIDSGRSQYRGAYGNQAYGHAQGYPNQAYGYGNPAYPNQAYGYGNPAYPNQAYGYGYGNQGHPNPGHGNAYAYGHNAPVADLRFSCRVDFRGQITALDIKRNVAARRGY